MAPKKQTFKGLDGYPNIVQDGFAMLRSIYIGALVADRDHYRSGRPGMKTRDYDRIEDPAEREDYKKACRTLRNCCTNERTQTKGMLEFFNELGLDPSKLSAKDIPTIQEKLADRYRIIFLSYNQASGMCHLKWKGEEVMPKIIYIVSDSVLWDALGSTYGVFKQFMCGACLKPSKTSHSHRCEHTCSSCSSLLVEGNCDDGLRLTCSDCNFMFKSQKCFDMHKSVFSHSEFSNSRCDQLKFCMKCSSVYRTAVGHECGKSIYCDWCREYTNNEHDCSWEKLTDEDKERLELKQETFKFAFFDIETMQCTEREDGKLELGEHFCTTISICKVCHLCEDSPIDEPCEECEVRMHTFQYVDSSDGDYDVVDRFTEFLRTEPTMKKRTLFAHNGARFDAHLVLKGFHRVGIYPKFVEQGNSLIRVEVPMRDRKLIIKDSYRLIPMALNAFPKAFELDCDEKGEFPHFANMRSKWGKVWDSIPPKRYFGYRFMKPEKQKSFDEWYDSQIGKPWDQDAELRRYCEKDVEITMKGCLKHRKIMMDVTGWCPLTHSNTLAAFCLFVLRADHLNEIDMPYIPENGYGAVNQSITALKYIRWIESKLPYDLEHALSPRGEKKVTIGKHTFSIDCFDPVLKRIIEIMGCYFHGCRRCYPAGTKLVGGERADELHARTMRRIALLKTKYPNIEVKWECEIREELKNSKEMKEFFDIVEIIERLKIREALYGGRVEVLRSYLKATANTLLKYYDICSLYPSIQSMRAYPIGHPEVITSNFKPVVGNVFPYRGIVKLRVLPPPKLKLAVLPFRYDDALYFCLCATCAKEKKENCNHRVSRESAIKNCAWVGSFATVEVELALSKGYEIINLYEVYHWTEWSEEIYRDYFRCFMKLKQEDHCKRVGSKLGFDLQPTEVVKSAAMRTVSKLCNNSGWGKLAEVPIRIKTEFVKASDFFALSSDPTREIIHFKFVERDDDGGASMMLVSHRPKAETVRCNRYSAVHHAVLITANARCLLYSIVDSLGDRAAYMDTDSVVFEMNKDEEDPLGHLLTGELGDLSDEIDAGWQLTEAVFAGCKNYVMKIDNPETGETTTKTALRGVTKDANALNKLTRDKIYELAIEKKQPNFVNIRRPELKRKLGVVYSALQTKRYRPVSFKRATRGEGELEIMVPWGYIDD